MDSGHKNSLIESVVKMYRALIEKKNAAKRKTGVKFGSFSSGGAGGDVSYAIDVKLINKHKLSN